MKKYISDTLEKLNAFIQGMKANPNDWTNEPVKIADVITESDDLTAKSNAIDSAEATLKVVRHQGSLQNSEAKKLYSQCETFAYAIYADNTEKLADYGIKPRKDRQKFLSRAKFLLLLLRMMLMQRVL